MKTYRIYRSSRAGVLECAAFENGEMFLHTMMTRDASAPVTIETANIRLRSDYDAEQTLIPGVTKRGVFYDGIEIPFAEIKWNRDETYTVDFKDETFDAVRVDPKSFTFTQKGNRIGSIGVAGGADAVYDGDVKYEPSYTVEAEEGISQQTLIIMLVFPILYFGF